MVGEVVVFDFIGLVLVWVVFLVLIVVVVVVVGYVGVYKCDE